MEKILFDFSLQNQFVNFKKNIAITLCVTETINKY